MAVAIYIANAVIVIAVMVLVGLGKISWYEAAAFAAALLTPSAVHMAIANEQAKKAMKTIPPAAPVLALCLIGLLGSSSCTKQEATDVTKITAAILCAIEHAELDDAQLNALCGTLSLDEAKILTAHRQAVARTAAKSKTVCKDGGP